MNEGAKTGLFWCVAAVMVAIATFVAWPRSIDSDTSQLIGKPLFPDFEDPLVASNMKIVTYDEQQGTLSQFEVTKDPQTGVWKIPSHAGYPADAEEQMKASATALYDLTILDVPSRNAEDHTEFGVLEPDPEDLKVGDEGVGRLVDFRNEQGESVATLIVGDQVPDAPDQRYVRKPTQDVVYVVELDDEPLTTKFVDWIDNDLLQLTAFEIDRVKLNNYTASFDLNSRQVSQNKNFEAELDLEGSDWKLDKLVTFKEGIGVPKPLGEGEQLDTARLNELKQALDELKIAGVGRKPEGMSASLKADKSLINDQSAILSLLQRGFIPLTSQDGEEEVEILAANGEMVVTQKNGVEYVLRFGDIADTSADAVAAEAEDEAAPAGSNRYLLVTARVNESQIPVPELEEAPQTIEELEAAENAASGERAGEQAAAEEAPPADPAAQPPTTVTELPTETESSTETEGPAEASEEAMQPDAEENEPQQEADAANEPQPVTQTGDDESTPQSETESPATENAESESSEGEEAVDEVTGETTQSGGGSATGSGAGQDAAAQEDQEGAAAQDDAPAQEEAEQAEPQNGSGAQPATDEPAETDPEAATSDSEAASEAAGEEAAGAEAEPADAEMAIESEAEAAAPREETEQEKRERLEAIQEQIAKENQRKLDEREEKIQQARQRVAELNARFADWYYEISESTFRKLQLSQEELITTQQEAAASPNPAGGLPQSGAMPQFNLPGGP